MRIEFVQDYVIEFVFTKVWSRTGSLSLIVFKKNSLEKKEIRTTSSDSSRYVVEGPSCVGTKPSHVRRRVSFGGGGGAWITKAALGPPVLERHFNTLLVNETLMLSAKRNLMFYPRKPSFAKCDPLVLPTIVRSSHLVVRNIPWGRSRGSCCLSPPYPPPHPYLLVDEYASPLLKVSGGLHREHAPPFPDRRGAPQVRRRKCGKSHNAWPTLAMLSLPPPSPLPSVQCPQLVLSTYPPYDN